MVIMKKLKIKDDFSVNNLVKICSDNKDESNSDNNSRSKNNEFSIGMHQ